MRGNSNSASTEPYRSALLSSVLAAVTPAGVTQADIAAEPAALAAAASVTVIMASDEPDACMRCALLWRQRVFVELFKPLAAMGPAAAPLLAMLHLISSVPVSLATATTVCSYAVLCA